MQQQVDDEIPVLAHQLRGNRFDLEEFAKHIRRVDEKLAKPDQRDMQEAWIDVTHLTAPPALGEQSAEFLEVGNDHLSSEALLPATAALPQLLENQLVVIRIFGMHLEKQVDSPGEAVGGGPLLAQCLSKALQVLAGYGLDDGCQQLRLVPEIISDQGRIDPGKPSNLLARDLARWLCLEKPARRIYESLATHACLGIGWPALTPPLGLSGRLLFRILERLIEGYGRDPMELRTDRI